MGKVLEIGEVAEGERMNEIKKKEALDGEENMTTSQEMKKKDAREDGETVKSVKWINGAHLKIEKMIEEVAEIVIWTVPAHHVEVPMQEDGDVMTEEMIDLHQIEKAIGEKIEAEEGLMIVTVILSVVPLGEEEVKTAGVVRMVEMIEVLAMIEAREAMVVVLEAVMIVVHVVGMIVVVETTEVRLTGGRGLENLIEMKPQMGNRDRRDD